jgi:hypothetical protein
VYVYFFEIFYFKKNLSTDSHNWKKIVLKNGVKKIKKAPNYYCYFSNIDCHQCFLGCKNKKDDQKEELDRLTLIPFILFFWLIFFLSSIGQPKKVCIMNREKKLLFQITLKYSIRFYFIYFKNWCLVWKKKNSMVQIIKVFSMRILPSLLFIFSWPKNTRWSKNKKW